MAEDPQQQIREAAEFLISVGIMDVHEQGYAIGLMVEVLDLVNNAELPPTVAPKAKAAALALALKIYDERLRRFGPSL
jgi:hypothetical protein